MGEERFKEANLRAVLNLRGKQRLPIGEPVAVQPHKVNHDGRRKALADSERTQIGEERFVELNLRAVLNLRGKTRAFNR